MRYRDTDMQNIRKGSVIWWTLGVCLLITAASALAQDPAEFAARLDWVPISGAERSEVSGSGSAAATLSRSRLLITGSFDGLPAAATRASLRQGVATGARGPTVIADLDVTSRSAGTFSGEVTLNRRQREALLAGHLYLQLHAERGVAPDNAVLFGWLFADQSSE